MPPDEQAINKPVDLSSPCLIDHDAQPLPTFGSDEIASASAEYDADAAAITDRVRFGCISSFLRSCLIFNSQILCLCYIIYVTLYKPPLSGRSRYCERSESGGFFCVWYSLPLLVMPSCYTYTILNPSY